MKFRVERDVLADAVAWSARSLPARPPVPVLAGLLVEAQDDLLVLSGFDYEVSARVEVAAEVLEPGRALVSGRLLADIARSLPSRPVELATDGTAAQRVTVACGSARFTLLTLPDEDYPALPEMPTATGSVRGDALAAAVSQVAVAAGRDDTLPVLTGVRMEIEGAEITLITTDRYRLAMRTFGWTPESPHASAVALVPARTLTDAAKSLAGNESVTIALAAGGSGEGLIGFEAGGRRTTTRLLDGEFPKVRSLFPDSSESVATVETAALVEAVRRVALVAERNTPVRLSFSGDQVTLEAGTGDEAQATEVLPSVLDGQDISIAFNPGYLLDGLGVLGAPWARLSFTAPTRPAVLSGAEEQEGGASSDYRYLLMPVRLSG